MANPAVHAPPVAASAERKLPSWLTLGIIFGVVSAASILLWGPIGVSGTYPRFIAAISRYVVPDYATSNPYLAKMPKFFTTETMLVVGLLIGGFVASRLGKDAKPAMQMVHASEKTPTSRYRDAFIGGFLIILGARIAGGCTSGHIISGITQLSVSGMIFAAGVFAAGIVTAKSLARGGR
ncbi:MAG: YeeE/YedE family protein [Gemmatimonadetes bacterium]|nr:YeeE/YedE family protein [Gemmatimonadota bacterium]MBI3567860.1 YeeE/YedE family protein [Gemmatimonadota bacterium]